MMKKCYNGLFLLLGSLLLTFVCALNSGPAAAQTFPVQSNLQLVPPYSLALPGYVAPGSEKLVLNATLTDISRPQLDVELRVLIEGQGIRIQTNPRVNIRPVTLAPGIPVRLSGSDLEPYFRAENLQFFGLSRQQFITNGGALPEGIYRFCIDIVEANREVAIASRACGTAWLVLNDPPIVNLPRDQQKLAPVDPQFVRFQWTPRHTGSPNSAFTTEYDFQLVEVWPKGRNPNDAILTTTPIYETTTAATSLIYGPGEPALVRGRQYAFRIRARSIAGVEQLDLFRNEGFTQVQSFTYGDECIEPQGVAVEAISSRKLEVTWDAAPVHSGYLLEYREQGATGWMEERILFSDYTINGLAPRTNYEVQVFGFCGIAISEGSKVLKTKTQAEILGDFSCGSPPEAFNLENRTPLEQLQQGDVIDAGDFKVTMVEVSGSNGTFSGTGQVVVPMLNNVKAGTTFSNIKVNDEYRMYEGSMNFTGVTVQVLPGEILDDINNFFDDVLAFEEDLNKTLDVAQVVADSINSLVEEIQNTGVFTKEEYTDLVSEETTIEELQEEVKKSLGDAGGAATGGNIVEAAKQVARAKTLGKRIKDKKEQATHIDTTQVVAVRFLEGGSRGYDLGPGHNGIEPNYYKLITNRGAEHGPWYAVQSGQQARIQVEWLSGSNIPKEDISFTLADAPITALASRNGWELTVPASSPGDRRVLKALANGNTVGIAAVATYAQETRKVTLVRVNDAPAPSASEAQDYLNRVYGPAVVQWEVDEASVTIDDSWDLNGNGSMYIDENNDLSTYPDEAKAFIRAVRNSEGFERASDRYYMLFTDVTNSSNAAGFMPRKKQFGFVFTSVDESSEGLKHTLAHELGHGAFRLAHPWVEFPNLGEGQTQNLMDYGRGENLRKYQWDHIHDPKWVISLFDDEEEAGLISSKAIEDHLVEILNLYWCAKDNNRNSFTHYGFKTYISDWWGKEDLFDLVTSVKITGSLGIYDYKVDYKLGTETNTHEITSQYGTHQEYDVTTYFIDFPRLDSQEKIRLTFRNEADKLRFKSDILDSPGENKDYHYKSLNSKIPQLVVDENFDDLREILGLSPPGCGGFDLLSAKNKVELIEDILSDFDTNSDEEALILKLLQEETDKLSLIDEIINVDWKKLFRAIDNEREESLEAILLGLAEAYKEDKGINIVGHVENENFGRFDFNQFYVVHQKNGKVSLTRVTGQHVESNLPADWDEILQPVHPFDLITYSQKDKELDLNNTPTFPAILILKKIIENETQRAIDQAWLVVDVASLFFGVGEINLALKSTTALAKIGRVALGATDLLATATDLYCSENPNPELCEEWKKWGAYVQVGLIGASALDQFKTLVKKSDEFVAKVGTPAGGGIFDGPYNQIDIDLAQARYQREYRRTGEYRFTKTLDEVAAEFGEHGRTLVQKVELEAEEILSVLPSGQKKVNGDPVLSGIIDTKSSTNQVFYGRNLRNEAEITTFIDNAHPFIKERYQLHFDALKENLVIASRNDIERAGTTFTGDKFEGFLVHSEVVALDKAIKARGTFTEADLSDFLLHNKQLFRGRDGVPPRCVNCWHITDGLRVIGNN